MKPYYPNRPIEPSKTKIVTVKTLTIEDSSSLEDLIKQINLIENCEHSFFNLSTEDYPEYYDTHSRKPVCELHIRKEEPNPNYEQEMEKYKRDKKDYDRKLKEYHEYEEAEKRKLTAKQREEKKKKELEEYKRLKEIYGNLDGGSK